MSRITINITPDEFQALNRLASANFRSSREQLRWLLRQELTDRGFLDDPSGEHCQALGIQDQVSQVGAAQ